MTYGTPEKGSHTWALNEEQSRPFIKRAIELGINFCDTANVYSGGASEEVLGRTLRDIAKRDEVVVATKVYGAMRPEDPNGRGLSRKAILTEVDASLRRLGMDYVDLYQIHRWDYETPIEETLEALHDVVKAGKARYLGASSMFAWQFCKALHLADRHGWTRFVSMQPHYNLLYGLPVAMERKLALRKSALFASVIGTAQHAPSEPIVELQVAANQHFRVCMVKTQAKFFLTSAPRAALAAQQRSL